MKKDAFLVTRYWYRKNLSINFEEDGYLVEPDRNGYKTNPNIAHLTFYREIPVLVLLGEPGTGKSTEIKNEYELVRNLGFETIWLDLGKFTTSEHLENTLEKYTNNTKNQKCFIFMDGLDECLLRVDTVHKIISEAMVKFAHHSFSLRIACRTSIWPQYLENEFKKTWNENDIQILEIAPFTKNDVMSLADYSGINVNLFMDQIAQTSSAPLAMKPITLKFLIETFGKFGSLPLSKHELYLEGCKLLVQEADLSRIASKKTGDLDVNQRIALASRIATLTLLGNRPTIILNVDYAYKEHGISIDQICFGPEQVLNHEFDVTKQRVLEVLGTAFFSSGERSDTLTWSHFSYQEFLCSNYISSLDLDLKQIEDLFFTQDFDNNRIIPQLVGTAVWLSSNNSDFLKLIIERDPKVAIQVDHLFEDKNNRKLLVKYFLSEIAENKLLDTWEFRSKYEQLKYESMEDDLVKYISEKKYNSLVRRAAIEMVGKCSIQSCKKLLLEICLNRSEPYEVRVSSIFSLSLMADKNTKKQLKPLLRINSLEDPRDELKGYALEMLWPDIISSDELFSIITNENSVYFGGQYKHFLANSLAEGLTQSGIEKALEWSEKNIKHAHSTFSSFSKLMDSIFKKSWDYLNDDRIAKRVAHYCLARLRIHTPLFHYNSNADEFYLKFIAATEARRKIILNLIKIVEKNEWAQIVISRPKFLDENDLFWLVEISKDSNHIKDLEIICKLINSYLNVSTIQIQDFIIKESEMIPKLRETISWFVDAIDLNSIEAKNAKENSFMYIEKPYRLARKKNIERSKKRFNEYYKNVSEKNLDSIWQMVYGLSIEQESFTHFDVFNPTLEAHSYWKYLSESEKTNIIDYGKTFLLKYEPSQEYWFLSNSFRHPELTGFKFFYFFLRNDPGFLDKLEDNVWKKWTNSVVGCVDKFGNHEEILKKLIDRFFVKDPGGVRKVILSLIEEESKAEYCSFVYTYPDKILLEITEEITKILSKNEVNKKFRVSAVTALIRSGNKLLTGYLEQVIKLSFNEKKIYDEDFFELVLLRLSISDFDGWNNLWKRIIKSSKTLERFIFELAKVAYTNSAYLKFLNESCLSTIYVYLVKKYPSRDWLARSGPRKVGLTEQCEKLRDGILSELEGRGTKAACDQITAFIDLFPKNKWLNYALLRAQDVFRYNQWLPPTIDELVVLFSNRSSRFIRSDSQLLELVLSSIDRYQKKLKGTPPASINLWNNVKKKKMRPKNENHLSDNLKMHLSEDLINNRLVVNREVEIRPTRGIKKGEKLDIKLDTFIQRNGSRVELVSVFIEVKGCWNKDLHTSMKNQLLDRYMNGTSVSGGIYLVGFFNCRSWDVTDSRYTKTKALTMKKTRAKLDLQAKKLSTKGKSIKAVVLDTSI